MSTVSRARRAVMRLVHVGPLVLAVACTENVAAPGACPDYCPSGSLQVFDTTLRSSVMNDSAFGRPDGYVPPWNTTLLLAATLPGIRDSRPVFRTGPIALRLSLSTDTTSSPVLGVDSLIVRLTLVRRDTGTHNLAVLLYKVPLTIDSTTTFADLQQSFTDSLIRTVNVDSLIAQPGRKDPVTHDSVVVDSLLHIVTLFIHVDSAHVPIGPPDSGAAAFGVRVTANQQAEVAFNASENLGVGPLLQWYLRLDSLGIGTAHRLENRAPRFDSFVYDPPAPPLDDNLAVGGVPSTRSILRFALPKFVTDSGQVIRATLDLIPVTAPQGVPADSFGVAAHAVVTDFGAKSPLDPVHVDTTVVHIGVTDTVHINVTNILRLWVANSQAPNTMVLRQVPEGAFFAEGRYYSSRDPSRMPLLRLTFAPRFPFGKR